MSKASSYDFADSPPSSRVAQAVQTCRDHVASLRAAFNAKPANPADKSWVREKLAVMFETDQYLRGYELPDAADAPYSEQEETWAESQRSHAARLNDARNRDDLKDLLALWGWFTISEFGETADEHAWLLVQHADRDPVFQRQMLKLLQTLYPLGETKPRHYAYLFDRVAASYCDPHQQKLQRYGTQYIGNELYPVENWNRLDEYRAQVGLPPVAANP